VEWKVMRIAEEPAQPVTTVLPTTDFSPRLVGVEGLNLGLPSCEDEKWAFPPVTAA
jgi:hypothetical protein